MLDGAAKLISELAERSEGQLDAILRQRLVALCNDGLLAESASVAVLGFVDAVHPFPAPDFFLELARARAAHRTDASLYIGRALWQIGSTGDEMFAGRRRINPEKGNEFFNAREGTRVNITDEVELMPSSTVGICLLAPRLGLFDDFLPHNLYPGESFHQLDAPKQSFQKALFDLQDTHRVSLKAVRALVHTVALTGKLPIAGRTSFNCRLHYPGVIFVDSVQCDPQGLCEALVHECIHQALWLDYWTNSGDWFPLETTTFLSPATGRHLDAAVMVHAALIYSAIGQLRMNVKDNVRAVELANCALTTTKGLRNVIQDYPSSLQTLLIAEALAEKVFEACE